MIRAKSKPSKPAFFRYILAGVIVLSITLAMLAVSSFILTGKFQLFSINILG